VSELARTPLHSIHARLGARLVPFAGYEMPVQYSSIREEHEAVRERAGLFDVSHMGQLHLSGAGAIAACDRLVTCAVDSLAPGRARYGLMLNDEGGCVDDVMVTREAEDQVFLCVNAANVEKDRAWIEARVGPGVEVDDRSARTALLALQGPAAAGILDRLKAAQAELPRRFRMTRMDLAGISVGVSGTGYTGSPGFELYVESDRAAELFEAILETGASDGLLPAGLGARDTLRLEAALPLYGHELDETTSPLEAGLDRFVELERGGFIGHEALLRRESAGRPRQLVGFEMTGRGIARADYEIVHDGEIVGRVTSGAPSPSLGKSIGLGYVPPRLAGVGHPLAIRIRGKDVAATVVELPFLR